MKILALALIGVSAVALTACERPFPMAGHHRTLQPISQLNCPDSLGQFNRTGVSPDGKSCNYMGSDGAEVQLKLVSFSGDPDTALDPVEAQMKTLLPPPPPAPPPSSSEPAAAPGTGHDNVNIDLPGISIHADDKNANVHVAGVHIDADGQNNSVQIHGGGQGPSGRGGQFTVNADDNGAVIRSRAFGPNVEQSLILASKEPGPQGWRTVGYEAVGPKSGPLVVADFQSREDNHDVMFDDVKALAWKVAQKRG
jgi:hypothetical protein